MEQNENQNMYTQGYSQYTAGFEQQQATPYSTDYASMTNAVPSAPAVRSLDAILYTILGAIALILLYVVDFFTYSFNSTIEYKGRVIKDFGVTYYKDPFIDLFGFDTGIIILIILTTAIVALIVFAWIDFFRQKQIKAVKIVFSGVAFATFVTAAIMGSESYYNTSVSSFFQSTTTFRCSYENFDSFEPVFYGILICFALCVVIAILNQCGKHIFKTKSK